MFKLSDAAWKQITDAVLEAIVLVYAILFGIVLVLAYGGAR